MPDLKKADKEHFLAKVWKDPVWSKVISAGILVVIGTATTYFFGLWPTLKGWFWLVLSYLGATTRVPNWLFGLLIVSALVVLVGVGLVVFAVVSKAPNPEPDWKNYTSDNFVGLVWRWEYDSKNSIRGEHCYCPHCDFRIIPVVMRDWHVPESVSFECNNCGWRMGPIQNKLEYILQDVRLRVEHNIRKGTYKKY